MATTSPQACPPTLTQSLLENSAPAFTRATRAPFLEAAGNGLISRETLSQWLSQDRLYGQAYISFIGALLGHARLPAEVDSNRGSLQWRIVKMLAAALENIIREAKFYDDVAHRRGLSLDKPGQGDTTFTANEITQSYVDLFHSFLNPEKSLLEGMVVLWATEKCYLEAWAYALINNKDTVNEEDLDGGALREDFIPNWTSKEFVSFVENIATLLDELWMETGGDREAAEKAWDHVLELEEKFWPII
jgi:thiaminase